MLDIPLVQVREKLEQIPRVRHAKVTRGYPGMVFLEVEQRQPVAWLECPPLRIVARDAAFGCLLDADGFVLPSKQASAEQRDLPVIRVAKLARVAPGQLLDSPEVRASLRLLQAYDGGDVAHTDVIRRIDASRGYALEVKFESGLAAILPAEGFTKQLQRLTRIVREAAQQKWQIATVDLLVEKNVPVTFRAGDSPGPSGTSAPAQRRPPRTVAGTR
jgi:hypothetical protein